MLKIIFSKELILSELSREQQYEFDERAGICEFEGQLNKVDAEEIAQNQLSTKMETESDTAEYKNPIKLIRASELQLKEIPPLNWIVPGFLSEGCVILASRPKTGKSWLCFQLCLSVTSGQQFLSFPVIPQPVFYISYEDSERRLQDRLKKIMPPASSAPANFYFADVGTLPELNDAGLEDLESLINYNSIKLIIVDTFGRAVDKNISKSKISFSEDYSLLAKFQKFAFRNHVCFLLVHHTRKQLSPENVFDEIQGTTGVTAGADTLLVLKKNQSDYSLHIIGKDVTADDLKLKFDKQTCLWSISNKISHIETTPERMEIIQLLTEVGGEMSSSEIANRLGKTQSNISNLLRKMKEEGYVNNPKTGIYTL